MMIVMNHVGVVLEQRVRAHVFHNYSFCCYKFLLLIDPSAEDKVMLETCKISVVNRWVGVWVGG